MAEFRLALSYLKGRPIRSIMTVLSIVIGVMMMFGLNGMAPALKDIFISSSSSMSLADVDLYIPAKMGAFSTSRTSKKWRRCRVLSQLPVWLFVPWPCLPNSITHRMDARSPRSSVWRGYKEQG